MPSDKEPQQGSNVEHCTAEAYQNAALIGVEDLQDHHDEQSDGDLNRGVLHRNPAVTGDSDE